MSITGKLFGTLPTGEKVMMYTLSNKNHVTLTVLNFGGKMVNLWVPDKNGETDDIILGFDQLDNYLIRNPYFGTLVGRCANRIDHARFTLNGKEYHLDENISPHHLHGGWGGFDKKLWDASIVEERGQEKLRLTLFSPDGDQGYPGNLWTTVFYSLDDENRLSIEYFAESDADTIVNLTNHNYFNLNGHNGESVLNHNIWIDADYITDLSDDKIVYGKLLPVKDTPFDFNHPHTVGERYRENNRLLALSDGYDINYVLNRRTYNQLEKVCVVSEETSGRSITVYTTLPAMQFYTANYIKDDFTFKGKENHLYTQYCGLCLETQHNPNSINCPDFSSSVTLKRGEKYHSETIYEIGF
ncbi:MAG: aldose epimerase family protein [Fusicatenibacter sp.]